MTHDQTTPAPVEVTQADHRAAEDALFELRGFRVKIKPEHWLSQAFARHRIAHSAPAGEVVPVAMQHVAYFDEGQFHWMSGIAPRDCELYAKWSGHGVPTHPAPPADLVEFVTILHQYRSDMKHPPTPDSRERRVAMIDAAIAKFGRDA